MAKSDDGGYSDEDADEIAYRDGGRGGHNGIGEGGLLTIQPTPFTDTGIAAASKAYTPNWNFKIFDSLLTHFQFEGKS